MPIPVGERVSWLDPDTETLKGMTALFGVEATPSRPSPAAPWENEADSPTYSPVLPGEPLIFPWEEEVHPDFAADQDFYQPHQSFHQRGISRLLLVLLLLALVPVAWWLLSNGPLRPDSLRSNDSSQPAGVTQPLALPSADDGGEGVAGDLFGGLGTTPTAETEPAGVLQSTPTLAATPTLSDLERIAMTATALFADATIVTECVAPSWWVTYVIERGDTIEALAASRGVQRELLIVANCLAQPELEVGSIIHLPPVGVVADETIEATLTVTPTVTAIPTQAPVTFPTTPPVQFPTPTRAVTTSPTVAPTAIPPTAAPPTAAPPTAIPPTDAPTEEPTPIPTMLPPTEEPTSPPPPLPDSTPAPPPQDP